MSSFALKIIALISMLCDHTGHVYFGNFSILNLIGRLAFPIFAFQLTQGYIHTRNKRKYAGRLFIFALISEIPFMLFRYKYVDTSFELNIFFTLFLGFISIWIYEKNEMLGSVAMIFIGIIAELIHCDYGIFGTTIIFIFYVFKDNKLIMNIMFIFWVIFKYSLRLILTATSAQFNSYVLLCLFTIFALFPINLYNNKEGKKMKYLFYIFYPLHLLILYLI